MARRGPGRGVKVVICLIAVLLPGAALAATVVDGRGPIAGGPLNPAGLGLEGVPGDRPASPSAQVAVPANPSVPAPSTPVPVTTTRPQGGMTASTTTAPATNGSNTPTLPVPPPGDRPATTVPHITRMSSWSAENDGISVRLRMDPAEPAAGQPVTFSVKVSSGHVGCCVAHLASGDGSSTPVINASCTNGSDTLRGVTTHTYDTAGDYKPFLVVATVPCGPPPSDDRPWIRGVDLTACVVVGSSSVGKAACPG
ncbi:MAG: hypothetical protein M3203_02000 [Actinomycetota bacterium]|nr:hypothetical protein [Actinomycetota bacterium]